MDSIQEKLCDFVPVNTTFAQFKAVVNSFIIWDPQLRSEEIINSLRKDLTAKLVFRGDLVLRPNTQFQIYRDYLVWKELRYKQHPKRNKLTCDIANFFSCWPGWQEIYSKKNWYTLIR